MSTHNMCFLLRNKKDISIFLMKKSTLSVAMRVVKTLLDCENLLAD